MPFAYAALAVSVVSAGASYSQQKKAAKEQKKAQEAEKRASSVEAARARMEQIREARIRAARIKAQAGAEGTGMVSSGIAGALSSIGSQTGANIGAINVQQGFANEATAALQRAASAQSKAATWQQIGQVSGSIFSDLGGFTSIFGGNTSKPAVKQKTWEF